MRAASEVLMASSRTEVSKLSGAIASRLRETNRAKVKAMGPLALQTATRALLRSGDWLRQERTDQDIWVSCERTHSETKEGSKVESHKELLLEARLLPKETETSIPEEDVFVSQKSNIGHVAAFVATRLKEEPNVAPTLRSVGPQAANQALRAMAIARGFVANDHPGEELLFLPREEKKREGKEGEHLLQLVLVCHRKAVGGEILLLFAFGFQIEMPTTWLATTFDGELIQANVVATTAATTVAGTTARPVVRKAASTVRVTTTVAGTTGAASKAVAPSGKATASTSKGDAGTATTTGDAKTTTTKPKAAKAPAPPPPSQGWISWIFSNWFYLAFFFGTVLPACMGLMTMLPMLSRVAGR
eukprot:symbB.v1.2.009318.t1/scaffold585.1/size314277/8